MSKTARRLQFELEFPPDCCLWCSDMTLQFTPCLVSVATAYVEALPRLAAGEYTATDYDAGRAADAAFAEYGDEVARIEAARTIALRHP